MLRIIISFLFLYCTLSLTAQNAVKQAEQDFSMQKWESAIGHYRKHLAKNKNDSLAQFKIGLSYHYLQEYEKAEKALQKARKMNFNPMRIDYYVAKGATQSGDSEKALNILKKAAENGFWAYGQLMSDIEFDPIRETKEFKVIMDVVEKNAFPCLSANENKKLDFWLGDWDVYVRGNKVGQNKITKAQGGCSVHEFYTTVPGGFAGQSINYYDHVDKKWKQNWVGNSGSSVTNFVEIDAGEGMLQFLDANNLAPNGDKLMVRMTFTYLSKYDAVKQFIESSTDAGTTWSTVFNGLYVKSGTEYPADYSY